MTEISGYRAVEELCQYDMTDEQRSVCREVISSCREKVEPLCQFIFSPAPEASEDLELWEDLRTQENRDFCANALPAHEMHSGRLIPIPHLPLDYDELPDEVQESLETIYSNAEDIYTAAMEDGPIPAPEVDDGSRPYIVELFGGVNIGGIRSSLQADGENLSPTDHRQAAEYAVSFGGGLDFDYQIDISEEIDFFVSAGFEYFCNYSMEGANVNTYYGRLRFGPLIRISESSDFEVAAILKLGYLNSDGLVYHPAVGDFELSNFDGAAGGYLGWMWHEDLWRVGFGIEGLYTFTRDYVNGTAVGPFPIPFILTMRTGWNL